MKKQLNQLRRFFARTSAKRLNAATAREAIPASYDEDESDTRLSGAFVVVLILHVVAIAGVFAFSKIRDKNAAPAAGAPAATADTAASAAVQPDAPPAAAPAPETPRDENSLPALPPEPAAPPAAGSAKTYVVKAGDTLTRIALAYGVTPAEIVAANKLKSQDDIKAGQEIAIPTVQITPPAPEQKPVLKAEAKSTPPAKSTPSTYTIKKGDTLIKVARDMGVSYDELTKLNNIKDPRKIQIGQVVKIPRKK